MPKISDINDICAPGLDIPGLPWLHKALGPELIVGFIYLVAGAPGIGKSSLSLQVLGALCSKGIKVLYIPTEQSLADIKRSVDRLLCPESCPLENLYIDSIRDISVLPWFLYDRVVGPGGDYHGIRVIVIDSLQGGGLGTQTGEKFQALKDFVKIARKVGITCILTNHVTKSGEIAGPKTLEHEVDCVLYLRRASRLRALYVPKYRDHPTVLTPIMLSMDERGLDLSPHAATQAATALGYCGNGDEFSEVQASVAIPRYGSSRTLNVPYLPTKKIQQLLNVIGSIDGIEALDASYDISCGIPGGANRYAPVLDLAIVVAILSSYLHQPVDCEALFVGEVDLTKQIRPPGQAYLHTLAKALATSTSPRVKRVYLSEKAADEFKEKRVGGGSKVKQIVEVRGVANLDSLLRDLWPSLFGQNECQEPEAASNLVSFPGVK
jgi:DNA repair protein RadA/Sms